jgi:hypothetical protein
MRDFRAGGIVIAALVLFSNSFAFGATTIAKDDASDPVYTPGNYHGLNGGFGLGAWQTNGFPVGGNPNLQAYVSTSTLNGGSGPDIDTAGAKAWGNNAIPGGNTFLARRSLTNDVAVGGTYAISMDNGDVDGKETIAFGLNANAMCQFSFDASVASGNYTFYDTLSNTTIDTGILQTFGGMRLTLTRTATSTYSFQSVRLSDLASYTYSGAYDTSIITGIRTIQVSNTDGGNGPGHAMFVNSMEATMPDVPEPSSFIAVGGIALISLRRARR